MTVWDNIYKKYKKEGEEYATLRPGLNVDFLDFVQKNNFKVKKALDIGCGNGKYLVFLKSLGFRTDGIDSSPTAVEMTKAALNDNSNIILADIYGYGFPKEEYDLVLSIAAIHHGLKSQVARAIAQIYQALLPEGLLFITLPDNEGSAHWTMMANHKEIEPGTRIPLSGPEKGLPHSSFTKEEIREMFSDFTKVELRLLAGRGRWIIMGRK